MHLAAGRADWKGRLKDLEVPETGCMWTDPLQWQVMPVSRRSPASPVRSLSRRAWLRSVTLFARWFHPGLAYCVPCKALQLCLQIQLEFSADS